MEEQQGFVFLPSYYEAIRELPAEERLAVYDAICQYGLEGEWPELHGIARTVLLLIRPTLDRGQRRYKAARENGKKGGNPNFQKGRRNPYYPEDNPKDNQTDNPAHNQDKDKETDMDKDMDTEKEEERETESARPAPGGTYENVLLSSCEWARVKREFPDTWLWHVNRVSALLHAGTCLPGRTHCDAIFALAEEDILNGHIQWGRGP